MVNTGEGPVRFVTDQDGYRISWAERGAQQASKPDVSIITIGNSFLEALQVENERTIPQLLERFLERKYGREVLVVNDGVTRWNPGQYCLEAKRVLARKKYDLGIMFLFVGNDIASSFQSSFQARQIRTQHRFRLPRTIRWGELNHSVFYPSNDVLETRSHLFILFKRRSQVLLSKVGLTAAHFPQIFSIKEKDSTRWEVTAEISRKIYDEFQRYHTPVFFVLLPTPYQVHEEIFDDYVRGFSIPLDTVDLEQPNKLLARSFRERSLRLVDPLEFMRQKAKEGVQLFGSVDPHLNAQGHRIVSQYIAPFAEEYLSTNLQKGRHEGSVAQWAEFPKGDDS